VLNEKVPGKSLLNSAALCGLAQRFAGFDTSHSYQMIGVVNDTIKE
jgi:hypothetical protein